MHIHYLTSLLRSARVIAGSFASDGTPEQLLKKVFFQFNNDGFGP